MSQAAVPRAPVDEQPRLAVLIDADNAQAAVIDGLLAEVARYGVASVKRIYGDFTAQRLREAGLTVYGFGERKTPDPFVQACDKFVYTEILRQDEGAEVAEPAEPAGKGRRTGKAKAKPARAGETTGSRRGLRKLLDQA